MSLEKLGVDVARFSGLLSQAEQTLSLSRTYSLDLRRKYASEGIALPDGSYPIPDVAALRDAIQAYGRSNPEDRAKVRAHIKKRARALNRADLIPDKWL